jgi:hypothetical protein
MMRLFRTGVFLAVLGLALGAGSAVANEGASDVEKKLKAIAQAKEALNGTSWSIQVSPMAAEGGSPTQDKLDFVKGKLTSQKLSGEGYSSSNFTVTLKGNGTTVWETMQSKPDKSVAFWRGELRGETVRGVLSKRQPEGSMVDFAFSGRLVSAKPAPVPVPAPVPTPTPTAEPVAPAEPQAAAKQVKQKSAQAVVAPQEVTQTADQKAEKKGWFW